MKITILIGRMPMDVLLGLWMPWEPHGRKGKLTWLRNLALQRSAKSTVGGEGAFPCGSMKI